MKTVTRYTINTCYGVDHSDHQHLVYADSYKPAEDYPEELVSAVDYDSLQSRFNEAMGAVQYLLVAFTKALEGKPVMNADEVIAQAETVLNRL